ncbi:DNA adenine methylase [Romboutsia timonensis]|uniref:DNA adenine methylase n=1 Tax=Romboutsia timonensis TaxID=1776391 RepID=UPI0008D9E6DF|nr:DNA adenine methylase [Romboutsia timonensis]
MLVLSENIPSLVKYMGSKTEIINYVVRGLNEVHKENQAVCDLFAGSSTLAGALRSNNIKFISNDIQIYSSIFTKTYLSQFDWNVYPTAEDIVKDAEQIVESWINEFNYYWEKSNYEVEFNLSKFNEVEKFQQDLNEDEQFYNTIKNSSKEEILRYHLFAKEYSGTYWSFRQCVWIDAFRCIADKYSNIEPLYNLILSCTMYAMAYNSQSTGHYAQYRKAEKDSSMEDILIYRKKSMSEFFIRKYNEIKANMIDNNCKVETYSLSYEDCISQIDSGTLVYADPPYCSVHYSRFYHILETFVKYDYPKIRYGGRYRTDRHQSPFCILTKVRSAFKDMFINLKDNDCELVLSYSNSSTCMITLETILLDAYCIFNNIELDEELYLSNIKSYVEKEEQSQIYRDIEIDEINININSLLNIDNINLNYEVTLKLFEHYHSTMGRTEERKKNVLETLIIVKKINK